MARREIIASDLTGSDLTGQENTSRKITVDGKSYSVDLSESELAALVTFAAGQGSDALAALLVRNAPARPARSRSGSRTAKPADGAAKREWLRANGYPTLGERGKFTGEMNAAYDTHTARVNGAAAASPAKSPATSDATDGAKLA